MKKVISLFTTVLCLVGIPPVAAQLPPPPPTWSR